MAMRLATLVLILLASGCGPGAPESDTVPPTEDLIRELFSVAWNTGDISGLDPSASADSILFHYRGTSSHTTLEDLGGLISYWHSAFPDLRMELLDLVGNGDLVAARVRYSGTHLGEWFGIAPTGRTVSVDEMMFFRFDDGLLVEAWEVDDQLSMRIQLGVIDGGP
ncbi:MAG: ester cyclase [Longimicrobiales bacterium]